MFVCSINFPFPTVTKNNKVSTSFSFKKNNSNVTGKLADIFFETRQYGIKMLKLNIIIFFKDRKLNHCSVFVLDAEILWGFYVDLDVPCLSGKVDLGKLASFPQYKMLLGNYYYVDATYYYGL